MKDPIFGAQSPNEPLVGNKPSDHLNETAHRGSGSRSVALGKKISYRRTITSTPRESARRRGKNFALTTCTFHFRSGLHGKVRWDLDRKEVHGWWGVEEVCRESGRSRCNCLAEKHRKPSQRRQFQVRCGIYLQMAVPPM